MSKAKKAVLGLFVGLAVIGGGIVLPAAPATAGPTTCHNVRILHTKANCNKATQICGYYTYSYICD